MQFLFTRFLQNLFNKLGRIEHCGHQSLGVSSTCTCNEIRWVLSLSNISLMNTEKHAALINISVSVVLIVGASSAYSQKLNQYFTQTLHTEVNCIHEPF